MAKVLLVSGKFISFLDNGDENNGGSVLTYEVGTTTPKTTYSDTALSSANANPVVLDSAGRANILFNGDIKIVVRDSSGNTIYTQDGSAPQQSTTPTALSTNTTLTAAHDDTIVECTAAITLSLTSAATLGNSWSVEIYNSTSSTITISRLNSGDTINGTAANTTLAAYSYSKIVVNNGATGFILANTSVSLSGNNSFTGNNEFTGVTEYSQGWGAGHVNNLSLTASVGSNALTIALKTRAGADATSTTPIEIAFGSATAATGDYTVRQVTAANSLVISSGSTLGTTSAQPNRLWIVAFDDAGTIRLGAINCSTSTQIFPLADDIIASSTAEGGAGAADSAGVFYTGTGVTSKPYRILGYVESTQATAGTWATTPSKVRLWTNGMKLPGDVVGYVCNTYTSSATGTTQLPHDNTIPQNTEGDEYITQAYTPTGSANMLVVDHNGHYATSAASSYMAAAIFQDSTANALSVGFAYSGAAGTGLQLAATAKKISGQTTSTTFKVRAGGSAAGTTTINGIGGAATYGGTLSTYLSVTELMG